MDSVVVNKSELVLVLYDNMEEHAQQYKEAYEGYLAEALTQAKQLVADIEAGVEFGHCLSLVAPVNHTSDYESIIRMLGMSVEEQIVLSQHDFTQYVMDNWSWKLAFDQTRVMYANKG
jgi:hypothetical protein